MEFNLIALKVTTYTPARFGVPEITPVRALTLKPGGKFTAPKLVGEPLAVIVYV
jgi:hypothetical protein